ncbi:hypothetical protein MTX26_23935 [Bradyrhizobium sp. ISRA443]|uniref:hypothetical protein n=1 Tax=unclassified Bradyrhizobium TaxID=2631580 RepID=UPI00247B0C9E|nr:MULTISPECIES: hypothetical protein [unclassified Bradyrhizobium]WGR92958.1 hypothetical protein MTX20_34825 [Bradyrhizobium sp. ISRA435]WGR97452.1 hypothetical protein MTX23_23930 [Bradyrhizobium sp. ISRA436]WGS04340.1 hypothetical protein MTX18_23930 [Bradyrhizobium sp. ISRA437]WGS11224.1 hypothetical protein MTX26_23935 [Bradyrhizobium sp. ISRA443]
MRVLLATGLCALIAGCTGADSYAYVPEFMRDKKAEPPPLEAPPDVKHLIGTKLDSVFTAGSQPTHVQVSPPLRDPRGTGWTACVRAELTSSIGKPLGTQTYRIFINDGAVFDRRRVETDDNCLTETYEPIS